MAKGKSTKGQPTIYKNTHKTKEWVTRTPLEAGSERMFSGRVGSSCSTSGTRRGNLVTNQLRFSIDHSLIIKDVHYDIKVICLYCFVLGISKIVYVNIKHRFKITRVHKLWIDILHSYIISTFLLPYIKWNCRDVICQFSIVYIKVLIWDEIPTMVEITIFSISLMA